MTSRPAVPEREPIVASLWRGPTSPSRLLAIRLEALGDTVLTLPYLSALHRLLPAARLDFLTREEVADVPKSVVLFDRVFEIGGGRNQQRQLLSALTRVPRLWSRRYDVVIDLQRNRISRIVRRLLNPVSWSEFDRFSADLAGERTRRTIEAVGLGQLRVRPDLKVKVPHAGVHKLRSAGWDGESDLVVLNPAGAFRDRNWPLSGYVEFAHGWAERSVRPVQFLLLGLRTIAEKARFIQRALGRQAIDLVGRDTAGEAFAILRRATLVISEDSGLMHMSWVAGTPTIGLFGASRWVWARPHGNYSELVRTCRRTDGDCMDGTCREGTPHCLAQLQPAPVVELGLRLLARVTTQPKVIYESASSARGT